MSTYTHTHRFDYIAALEKAEADNAKLQEQLDRAIEDGRGDGANKDSPIIPRPAGTAGSKLESPGRDGPWGNWQEVRFV